MSVFKEEIYIIEQAKLKQKQIWNDAADIGILATDELKDAIRTLAKLKDSKCTWKFDHGGICQRSYLLKVYFDSETVWKMEVGYYKGRNVEFFTIGF